MTHQTDTARALLHRHGVPEDIVDGALAVHAQEVAAVLRREAAVWGVDTAAGKHRLAAADLIDPTKTPASVSSAGQAPATDRAAEELTAEEARALADDLGLQLYRAQDALAFVAECCTIAEREQRPITTADVREWLKGARCGRQLAADATDRAALRDRIAEALIGWAYRSADRMYTGTLRSWDEFLRANAYGRADAVLAVLPAPADQAAVRAAALHEEDDGESDELVCVDMCGSCDACGMEPFGTPAEGWRQAARFLRRIAHESGDRQGVLHAARLIEAELRRLADEAQQNGAS